MWEEVRTLRRASNVLWIAIVILGVLLYLKSKSTFGSSNSNTIKESRDDLQIEIYNAIVDVSGGVNLRSDPSSTANVKRSISQGSKINVDNFIGIPDTLDGVPGEWLKVDYKGSTGYVWGNYIKQVGQE